jgi:hypothetical protein
MTEDVSYRELLTRLCTALAKSRGCSYVEAKRRRDL